jgi:hypothetical protein
MVDAGGHTIKEMVVGQGVAGSYKDPRDGVTISMRKTMAARDVDRPEVERKCIRPTRGKTNPAKVMAK